MCSDERRHTSERVFVSKLNMILVQVLKQEWPHNWPSFVSDIVGASKVWHALLTCQQHFLHVALRLTRVPCCLQTSELLCENNLEILKLLRCVAFACTLLPT
jgi:exportin-1